MIDLSYINGKCYGCSACKNICPKDAIAMQMDACGFLVPVIDKKKCIDCGLCDEVCPIDHLIKKDNVPQVYAAINKNESVLLKSSSGGVFTAISDWILKENGVVFGAVYNAEKKMVEHVLAETTEQRDCMRGSKYVQSDIQESFRQIKHLLNIGKKVLFVGTSCQINGLYNYLGMEKYINLVTCDIICHGVASPLVFKRNVEFLEKKHRVKINTIDFRNKKAGWSIPHPVAITNDKEIPFDFYTKMYYKDFALRENCYHCPYADINRIADITIGDFWGIEKANLSIDYEKGCSLILVNSKKGEALLENIKKDLIIQKSSIEQCMQKNLKEPTERPTGRDAFWKDFWNLNTEEIASKYGEYGIRGKVRVLIRKCKNKVREIFR